MERAYEQFEALQRRVMALQAALTLFEWDAETQAPTGGAERHAELVSTLSGEYFRLLNSEELRAALSAAQAETLTEAEALKCRELQRELEKLDGIEPADYEAFSGLRAKSVSVWMKARQTDDFSLFAPYLEQLLAFQRKFAGLRRKSQACLYDVLLADYEPDFSVVQLDAFFAELKAALVPLLKRIQTEGRAVDSSFLRGDFPQERQEALGRRLAAYIGFDFERGVLAVSEHPFTTNLHNRDVRLTSHYRDNLDSSLFSVLHEAGHGIYEQGISDELTLSFAGQGASMGMHESQSRFYENLIGRSRAFWEPLYGELQASFPEQLGSRSLDEFIEAINEVKAGLIRIESDELSYSLHILIRYELEKALMAGELSVSELPKRWADKYEEYLGLRPQTMAEGVLQDIHWAWGEFGYFPSYALGSAFGAQLLHAMRQRMDVDMLLREGRLDELRRCLNEAIHCHGKRYTSAELLERFCGEAFTPVYYVNYLTDKFSALYGLEK